MRNGIAVPSRGRFPHLLAAQGANSQIDKRIYFRFPCPFRITTPLRAGCEYLFGNNFPVAGGANGSGCAGSGDGSALSG